MSIVLFSGGRGNKVLLSSIAREGTEISHKFQVIVNGLDDGASTGEIRELLGNQSHGISDFLKVTLAMSPNIELQEILEERLPILVSIEDQLESTKVLYDFIFANEDIPCLKEYKNCDHVKGNIREYFFIFLEHLHQRNGALPNLSDFKIGNIVFSSMLINRKLNFQEALTDFMEFCDVSKDRFEIIQSTETNSYLVGLLKNGSLLPNEAAVVLTRTTDTIDSTFQLSSPLSARDIRNICSMEIEDKKDHLKILEVTPEAGIKAISAIIDADAIIYGAGTPYSSVLPSLELNGMASAIRQANCPKILVVNLAKETSNTIEATDVVDGILEHLNKSISDGSISKPSDYLTHIIIPNDSLDDAKSESLIRMNKQKINKDYKWVEVIEGDIRATNDETKHDGFKLKQCLMQVIDGG